MNSVLDELNVKPFWDAGIKGQNVIIAVIDSGYNLSHEEFNDRVIEATRITYNTDETSMDDKTGHGTPVASIIAGNKMGIAPEAQLLLLRVYDDRGSNNIISNINKAIRYVTDWKGPNGQKVDIINISMGTGINHRSMQTCIDNAVNKNILVVCAAGNNGDGLEETDEWSFPAGFDRVVSVGAYSPAFKVATYSNSNINNDLISAGSGVSAASHLGGYRSFSGTSSAAPCVSGACALLINKFMIDYGRKPTEPELFEELIKHTTVSGITGSTGKRSIGNGRLLLDYEEGIAVINSDYDKYFSDFDRMTSPYGLRFDPFTGESKMHTGIDYVKKHDDPIYSQLPGTVLHAIKGINGTGVGGFGIIVIIRDKYGNLQLYAHLNSALVKVGQNVIKGQVIGRQGSTGRSTGSHLHFEVRTKSTPSFGYGFHTHPIDYLDWYWEEERKEMENKNVIFNDVPNNHWAIDSIKKAKAKEIMIGYSDGSFKPDDNITRAQLAKVLDNLGLLD